MTVSDNLIDVSSNDISSNDVSNGDVSVNEILNISGNEVPVNTGTEMEIVTETQVQYMTGEYDADILAELQQTNYLITALLFFTVFSWIAQKLHNSVKKVVSIDD